MFEWMPKHPKVLQDFNISMASQHHTRTPWYDIYPLEAEVRVGGQDPGEVFLIDIGGGSGEQSKSIRKSLPNLKGRIILQDLAPTLERALASSEYQGQFEVMVHDFFKPQPVKGKPPPLLLLSLCPFLNSGSISLSPSKINGRMYLCS